MLTMQPFMELEVTNIVDSARRGVLRSQLQGTLKEVDFFKDKVTFIFMI